MPKRSNKGISFPGADCPLDHLMKSSQITILNVCQEVKLQFFFLFVH